MIFEASRSEALNQLNNFVENNLGEYSKLRNFDFGPEKRSNISCLSPYITHGIINEQEVIQKALSKFSFSKNEKFIQEVLWRTYWKGWLERRPNVWPDYLIELNQIKNEFKDNKDYIAAIEGKTKVDCFNEWVKELKENNYLHNHTRMWFASIWIFTLDLPWQLGAKFFMQDLYCASTPGCNSYTYEVSGGSAGNCYILDTLGPSLTPTSSPTTNLGIKK